MTNITVDWKVFNYKFASDPRMAFQNLSYMLFCYEFKQKFGIFRYFNQPHIETQPIRFTEEDLIGFQAKYYDDSTRLSSKKQDFIDAIKGSKEKYSEITRIIFYTNKELTASSQKDKIKPQYQEEIENYGNSIGISVEWRVTSNFEIMLQVPELNAVRDLFFNPNEGLQEFAEKINNRSTTLINGISSEITFNGRRIKITHPQSPIFEFASSEKNVFIVYGNAGTGKSGYIKDFVDYIRQNQEANVLAFSTTDFDVKDEGNLLKQFGEYNLEDLLSLYSSNEKNYIIIDSAEKYCCFYNPNILQTVIHKFLDHGWKIVFTIRKQYKDGFSNAILDELATDQYCIDCIDEETLKELSEENGFELPENSSFCDLIRNLFYLNLYLHLISDGVFAPSDIQAFINLIWNQVIRNESIRRNNLPVKRENFIINMASSMMKDGVYTYSAKVTDDSEAISCLEDQGIIVPYNDTAGLWCFNHDVYEEIIVNHIFDDKYGATNDINMISAEFGNSLRSRKMYRLWLETKLKNPDNSLLSSLISVLGNSEFSQSWQDETLIALMNSENDQAFQIMESLFSSNDYALFTRSVFLLNTACKCVNRTDLIFQLAQTQSINSYHFTEPTGSSWHAIFCYIYRNKTRIPWKGQNWNVVIEAMNSWVSNNPYGETTALVGNIALFLKKKYWEDGKHAMCLFDDSISIGINKVILLAALEIKEELSSVVDRIIQNKAYSNNDQDYLFLMKTLANIFDCGKACEAIPEKILDLAWNYWLYSEKNNPYYTTGTEIYFGLNEHLHYNYYPSSAFQTPLVALLSVAPQQSIDFIINLSNCFSDCYKDSPLNKEYNECFNFSIKLTQTETINQICSDRLWQMHRGTGVAPDLLESVLMALERFLLKCVEEASETEAKELCLYCLRKSNNVAITAIVLSVIIANPDKLFDVSCILLKTKEVFWLDNSRLTAESSANLCRGMLGKNQLFDKERIESNNKEFRKKSFKDAILNYQINGNHLPQDVFEARCKQLYKAIDEAVIDIQSWEPFYQAFYYSIDLRKYKQVGEVIEKDGYISIPMQPDLPQLVIDYSERSNAEYEKALGDTELMLWASYRFNRNEQYKQYRKFEEDPLSAFQILKTQIESSGETEALFQLDSLVFTTVVLLRDFGITLNEEQSDFCQKTLVSLSYELIKHNSKLSYMEDVKAAIVSGITTLADSQNINCNLNNPIVITLAFMLEHKKLLRNNFINPLKELWESNKRLAEKLFVAFVRLYPEYDGRDIIAFLKKHKKDILRLLQTDSFAFDPKDLCRYDFDTLMYLCCIVDNRNSDNLQLIITVGKIIWEKLFYDFNSDGIHHNYQLESFYISWLAEYLLNISDDERSKVVGELIPYMRLNREFDRLLSDIVNSEDKNPRYDAFWNLWSLLQDSIIQTYEKNADDYKKTDKAVNIGWGYEDVLLTFLLAYPWWRECVSEWHSLKNQNKTFYLIVAHKLGFNPTTLFSIARVLYTVGKKTFKDDGVDFLCEIIKNNPHLRDKPLPEHTLFYMEEYMISFVKGHFCESQTNTALKRKIEIILDFLVTRGSTVGFLLREEL